MLVDLERKTVRLKVVYYGPAQSGKTTNLERLSQLEGLSLMKLDTQGEKTLVFDFTTKKVKLGDLTISFALYTIPGQEVYRDIRKTVLRGVDGIVFVADAQKERLAENLEFLSLLKTDLSEMGKSLNSLPLVLQYNKMDLPNALGEEHLQEHLNPYGFPHVCAIAAKGEGVRETFGLMEGFLISKLERLLI